MTAGCACCNRDHHDNQRRTCTYLRALASLGSSALPDCGPHQTEASSSGLAPCAWNSPDAELAPTSGTCERGFRRLVDVTRQSRWRIGPRLIGKDVVAVIHALVADRHPVGAGDHLAYVRIWLVAERADDWTARVVSGGWGHATLRIMPPKSPRVPTTPVRLLSVEDSQRQRIGGRCRLWCRPHAHRCSALDSACRR